MYGLQNSYDLGGRRHNLDLERIGLAARGIRAIGFHGPLVFGPCGEKLLLQTSFDLIGTDEPQFKGDPR
jgi:hypothetical protein